MNTRISKACQECRQRKIRCTGGRPCKSCQVHSTECVYRHLTRVRKSLVADGPASHSRWQMPLASSDQAETPIQPSGHPRDEGIYHSISATQSTAGSGNLQLYYGASSNFAFLQQLHRSLLLDDGSEIATPGEVQEGGAGLDLFHQRGLFFGTTATDLRRTGEAPRWETLPPGLRDLFLEGYLETIWHISSFIQPEELRSWAHAIFDKRSNHTTAAAQRCVCLAVLANGATTTEHAEWAEVLYKAAKTEAHDYDEVVNLHSVQFSLLLAIYQNTMGRPNQAYLHLGSATRKAFAMGLHKDIDDAAGTGASGNVQQRRTLIWCLYFHECWQSFSLGRVCSVKRSDIAFPCPESEAFLGRSARLLEIALQSADMMYGHRRLSLWETWKAAESIHTDLRRFAEEAGLAFASRHDEASQRPMQSISLTCFYYHAILLTFRPFLIVAAARQRQRLVAADTSGNTPGISLAGDEMWLREACRYAVDSSRDQISFMLSSIRETDICKRLRYHGFFIESSCAVLVYDSLMNKHTYSHNLEYIKAGLQCLEIMQKTCPGEPVRTALTSIERIVSVLDRKLSSPGNGLMTGQPLEYRNAEISSVHGRTSQPPGKSTIAPQPNAIPAVASGLEAWNLGIPQVDWSFDVFTTDLNRFFPLDDSYGAETVLGSHVDPQQYLNQDYRESYP